MILRIFKFSVIIAIVAASVATPLVVHHHTQVLLREKNEALTQEAGQLAKLMAENQRLSNLVAEAKLGQRLSSAQLTELLRLRGEMRSLRERTNTARQMREENQRLQAQAATEPNQQTQMSRAELERELSTEMLTAMRIICRELPGAVQRFANEHTNQGPTDFSELRKYFPAPEGHGIVGLHSVVFVRDAGYVPGDALVLRAEPTRKLADGKQARVYGFSDGRAVEVTVDNGNFDDWEKQQMTLPATAGQAGSDRDATLWRGGHMKSSPSSGDDSENPKF